jgi:hypothetical protein
MYSIIKTYVIFRIRWAVHNAQGDGPPGKDVVVNSLYVKFVTENVRRVRETA